MNIRPLLCSLVATAFIAGPAFAENPPVRRDAAVAQEEDRRVAANTDVSKPRLNDPGSTVARAADVYKAFTDNGKVPASVTDAAKCVAVFPSVVTAAVGVGGFHGDGVAFCKAADGKSWGNPVFLNLTGGSIGLQAGYKNSDIVMYMTAPNSRAAIEKGEFELAGELSAIAGSTEEKYAPEKTGVVIYSRSEGVFAGATLNGVSVSHDQDEQRAFYGKYDRNSMWEGQIPPAVKESVTRLQRMLPA